MEYGKIIAITGLPGLFELLSSKNDGAIVRSLEDKSTKFVSSRVHNFSHLESIEVFTVRDNVNLSEIFLAMEKEGTKAPDAKDAGALKKYFLKISPDIDLERVYASDLKKMVKWFEVLKDNNVEIKLTERAEEPEEAVVVEEVKPAPAKKAAPAEAEPVPKKAAKKKAEPKAEAEAPAKAKAPAPAKPKKELSAEPAKKAAPKKAAPKKK